MAVVADNRVWKLLDDHEIHDGVKQYLRDVVKIKTTDDLATYLDAASASKGARPSRRRA